MKFAQRAGASRQMRRPSIFELQPLEVRRFLTTASLSGGVLTVNGTGSAETITLNRLSNGRVSVTGVGTTFLNSSFDEIVINAQGGSDVIFISGNVLYDSSVISAGSGNDWISGGRGADAIFAQDGFDTVSYSSRTNRVTVTLDGNDNDGESGEGDNVNAEEVIGGAGSDVFVGNGSGNYFAGNGGNDEMAAGGGDDELIGSTGADALFGEGDDDALYAKNNDRDTVNGGTGPGAPDLDLAALDGIDVAPDTTALRAAAREALVAAEIVLDPDVLDPTYGGNGTGLNWGPDFNWSEITAAVVDSQGRTVIVGYDNLDDGSGNFTFDFVAMRYNADGTWDDEFAGDGEAAINFTGSGYSDDDFAYGVNVDANDNIIIVGSSSDDDAGGSEDFAICRLDQSGTLDTVFGLRRYDVVTTDSVFGSDQADIARDVVVDEDGRIVVVGTHKVSFEFGNPDIAIMRLEEDGDLDSLFNGTGMNTLDAGVDEGVAVAMQRSLDTGDLAIIAGGTTDSDFLLARFNLDGTIDTPWGNSGPGYSTFGVGDGTIDVLNDIAVNDTNGEIAAVGQSYFFVLTDGGQGSDVVANAIAPTPQFDNAVGVVAAFSDDGTLANHRTHAVEGNNLSFNAIAWDAQFLSFAVAGSTGEDFVVAKFDASAMEFQADWEGLVLTDFTPPEDFEWNDIALGVGFGFDGKIIVGGYTDTCGDGCIETAVARYGDFVDTGEGPTDVYAEVEGFISYEDVQNGFGDDDRSAVATFFLKSTLLDDEGRAHIALTNVNGTVKIYTVVNDEDEELVAVDVDGLIMHYGAETTAIIINGGNGNDCITATDDVFIPLVINGGNGNDVLGGGGANDIIRGENGVDLLTGGDGDDVLLGGNSVDVMLGGDGNDILIGGTSADGLAGDDGEDILIGGTTDHDDDDAALASLSSEWGSSGTNAERIANLRNGGGLNGATVLTTTTVHDDGAIDLYTGGNGRDWFFRRVSGNFLQRDTILDDATGEELTTL